MIRYQVGKYDKNLFNSPTQQIQKMKNTYNTKGPKGSEVRENNNRIYREPNRQVILILF